MIRILYLQHVSIATYHLQLTTFQKKMHQNILFDRVKSLIESYDFSKPFSLYLKDLFRLNPKMGARDRRETRDYCYHFLRIGSNLKEEKFHVKLAVASFLCSSVKSQSLEILLSEHSTLSIDQIEFGTDRKLEIVKEIFSDFTMEKIFPDIELLSNEIDTELFCKSFLIQPRVWIRIRKKFTEPVKSELAELQIPFEISEVENVLSFSPMQKLEHLKSYENGYFEIQDLNSQRISKFLEPKSTDVWWDACAASGGKSLALIDKEEDIHLLATDVRENILKNYSIRMRKIGFQGFNTQMIDLSKKSIDPSERFEGILADVPCSGSGTWSRSPENLLKNHKSKVLEIFQPLQRKIVTNVVNHLRAGGSLVYSTCSVFKAENEENVEFFLKNLPLKLKDKEYLSGYEKKADSLFVASFEKVSN